jgi:hypothetical protein
VAVTGIRARKARRSSLLACGHYVLRGQLIVSPDGRTWICGECQLTGIREARDHPPPGTPPGPAP